MPYLSTHTDNRGITTITLDRPEAFNAMDRAFMDELTATLNHLDSNTRILVLAANGKHFCAGADINWMKQSALLSEEQNHEDAMALSNMLQTLNTFPRPTIARVQGAALGGGTGLVCCCDIAVVAEDARFAFSEVKLGILPATISPYAIAAIGARAARRYFQTAELIDAQSACQLGLAHEICPSDNLDAHVDEVIAALLLCGQQAQAAIKELIPEVAAQPVSDQLRDKLATTLASIRTGSEAQEGLGAFLEKRPPNWT